MVSFALMFLLPVLPVPAQLGLIILSTIGFDLGVQATLVAHQTLVTAGAGSAQPPQCADVHRGVYRYGDRRGARQRRWPISAGMAWSALRRLPLCLRC